MECVRLAGAFARTLEVRAAAQERSETQRADESVGKLAHSMAFGARGPTHAIAIGFRICLLSVK